jgi:glucokinase
MAWLGVDLGGTKVYGVRLGDDHEVETEAKVKTPRGGPEPVVAAVAALAEQLGLAGVDGVGVGVPGLVDRQRGVLLKAPNLPGWDGAFPLSAALTEVLGGRSVGIENDVSAGTRAEWRLGAGRGAEELLVVFVGTGVGGGLVLEGRLRSGGSGNAGEIGHTIVQDGGRLCSCGGLGHLEAYAGRGCMERVARESHRSGRRTLLVELAGAKRMTSGVFKAALDADDEVANELVASAVEALGAALAAAVHLLDLPAVVLGGGLADRLGPSFVARVATATGQRLLAGVAPLRIVLGVLGDRAGAIGAALMAEELAGAGGVASGL